MVMKFTGRKLVVSQVQRALGLLSDGIDGRKTWQEIVRQLPLIPVPTIPSGKSIAFKDRATIVKRVQRALGDVLVDGRDGQETWAALAQRFDPDLAYIQGGKKPILETSKDGGYVERVRGRTPNRNSGTNDRKGLVIHHASGYFEGTVEWCLRPKTYAGYHCLIALDGERAILAHDTDRTHHAGKSYFRGRSGCNAFMMGLALTGNTNDGAMRGDAGPDLTADEVYSACQWIQPRMKKYGWTKKDIVTHAMVAPARKDDVSLKALSQILDAL